MNSRLLLLLVAGTFAAVLPGRESLAIIVASDSFDYTTGNVAAQNGRAGFSSAWASSGGTAQVQSPGLTYPSVNSAGNKAFISASNQNWRTLSSGTQGTGDSTLWISFIGQ